MMKEESNQKKPKKLRAGYTTGACAQAASKAAVMMLLTGKIIEEIEVQLPVGEHKHFPIINIKQKEEENCIVSVRCGVKKDSGDDPDVTDGMIIYSTVSFSEAAGIVLCGGEGVGTVTKPGLEQPVGDPAINKVPRDMICREVEEAAVFYEYTGGLSIVIDVPGGEEIAEKTFNPRLGIKGGISILGTSGIVYPMSEQALIDTIEVEVKVKLANQGPYLLAAPGNYGLNFLEDKYDILAMDAVKCSNYVGETIDFAKEQATLGLLFAAHIGKFIKVAGGIMNTHSKCADCRMELLACAALEAGSTADMVQKILLCTTTEGALELFSEEERICVMDRVMERIGYYLSVRGEEMPVGAIVFSNVYGILGMTDSAADLLKAFQKQQEEGGEV